MIDENSCAMEKKNLPRQLTVQPKNNGSIGEKKSDYATTKNGRTSKKREPNNSNNGRLQELSPSPRVIQPPRNARPYCDKRPKPRGNYNSRQSEEVADDQLCEVPVRDSNSRKGNANHLLRFKPPPRGDNGQARSRYGSKKRQNVPTYSMAQFLQASCQFVVSEFGEYTEQSINPDALVNWDMVELVRTFNTQPATCPICLAAPYAGKITRCGHVFCWACILHHAQERDLAEKTITCPVCSTVIVTEDLRSVQCIEVKDYKVGDEIEMKLMRKNKGSVYSSPKSEWKDRYGSPHNIEDGDITQYMKLLLATCDQIQKEVIEREKTELEFSMAQAESSEIFCIEMAQGLLASREESLQVKIASSLELKTSELLETKTDEVLPYVENNVVNSLTSGYEITTQYEDAFEEIEQEEESTSVPSSVDHSQVSFTLHDDVFSTEDEGQAQAQDIDDSEDSPNQGSKAAMPIPEDQIESLTPEEVAEHLELPESSSGSTSGQKRSNRAKDTFYFYQAASGQHIYMYTLNAQCLSRDFGSLENSPETIKAEIVDIQRCFMTEDVRKRLRYLGHIPLTCEFHIVELKFKPPLVSKETLRFFQPEFDKRRKERQKKQKEDKRRAKQQEVEHRKSMGLSSGEEVHIPLDNLIQFPTCQPSSQSLASLVGAVGGSANQSQDSMDSDTSASPRQRNDSGSLSGSALFTDMFKNEKYSKSPPVAQVWGRSPPASTLTQSSTMPELRPTARLCEDEEGEEYLPAPSIALSWLNDLSWSNRTLGLPRPQSADVLAEENVTENVGSGNKKKKKKTKTKQVLFSTSMARKN